jgi:hypothetical protein
VLNEDQLPLKAGDDKHFLRYPRSSPLAHGAGDEPIGLPEADCGMAGPSFVSQR